MFVSIYVHMRVCVNVLVNMFLVLLDICVTCLVLLTLSLKFLSVSLPFIDAY